MLKPKFIRWNVDPKDKPPVDDDDIVFDSTDAQLKLMARILSDFKNGEEPKSWEDVFKYYTTELKWAKTAFDKQEKIEDPDELWQSIKDEIGEKEAAVIIPLCKGSMDDAKKAASK
mgnify:FL=1